MTDEFNRELAKETLKIYQQVGKSHSRSCLCERCTLERLLGVALDEVDRITGERFESIRQLEKRCTCPIASRNPGELKDCPACTIRRQLIEGFDEVEK